MSDPQKSWLPEPFLVSAGQPEGASIARDEPPMTREEEDRLLAPPGLKEWAGACALNVPTALVAWHLWIGSSAGVRLYAGACLAFPAAYMLLTVWQLRKALRTRKLHAEDALNVFIGMGMTTVVASLLSLVVAVGFFVVRAIAGSPPWAAAAAALLAGSVLYVFRRRLRATYGMTEVAAGVAVAIVKGLPASLERTDLALTFISASVYLIVRGLDNCFEGMLAGKSDSKVRKPDPLITWLFARLRTASELEPDVVQENTRLSDERALLMRRRRLAKQARSEREAQERASRAQSRAKAGSGP